jgi:hypothetical protein
MINFTPRLLYVNTYWIRGRVTLSRRSVRFGVQNNIFPTGIRTPHRPAPTLVTTPIMLCPFPAGIRTPQRPASSLVTTTTMLCSSPVRIRTPHRPAPSLVTTPTTLFPFPVGIRTPYRPALA